LIIYDNTFGWISYISIAIIYKYILHLWYKVTIEKSKTMPARPFEYCRVIVACRTQLRNGF